MLDQDNSGHEDVYKEIQDEHLSGGIDDDAGDPYAWVIEDDEASDDEPAHSDFDCECCEDCELGGYTQSQCECTKCESCGECENSCEVGFCDECKFHDDDCDCDKYCECCEVCEANDWLVSECQCAQCQTCLRCENTCLEPKCEACFSHLVGGVCENCKVTRRLHGEAVHEDDVKKSVAPKRAFRSWSQSEKAITRSLFTSGMSLSEIARHLDRTENAVVVQLANQGLLSDVDLSNAVHQAQLRYNNATKPAPEEPF